MIAREVKCKVIHKLWLTPSVFSIRFEPSRKFKFEPGQFLSVIVPQEFAKAPDARRTRRIYSLASTTEQGYELCVKMTGGPGPSYLSSLEAGDVFQASAPYGDFFYRTQPSRQAVFISTGTGIAPFRAMVLSRAFRENMPEKAISLFGAYNQQEILFEDEFSFLGVEVVNCLSNPTPGWKGFTGRVTDWLRQLPADWNWHGTDFYLCGNGAMVEDVKKILKFSRGVADSAVIQEVYFGAGKKTHGPVEPAASQPRATQAA